MLFVCVFTSLFFSFLAPVLASSALKKSIREGPAVTIISWIEACMSYSAMDNIYATHGLETTP